MKFTKEEFDKIGHTLGIKIYYATHSEYKEDKTLPTKFFRNYYNYGRVGDGIDTEGWILNISDYINTWTQSGLLYFQINDLGIEAFRNQFKEEITDKYVPMTRSKQRYRDFLRADTGQTFAEYLGIKR